MKICVTRANWSPPSSLGFLVEIYRIKPPHRLPKKRLGDYWSTVGVHLRWVWKIEIHSSNKFGSGCVVLVSTLRIAEGATAIAEVAEHDGEAVRRENEPTERAVGKRVRWDAAASPHEKWRGRATLFNCLSRSRINFNPESNRQEIRLGTTAEHYGIAPQNWNHQWPSTNWLPVIGTHIWPALLFLQTWDAWNKMTQNLQ